MDDRLFGSAFHMFETKNKEERRARVGTYHGMGEAR